GLRTQADTWNSQTSGLFSIAFSNSNSCQFLCRLSSQLVHNNNGVIIRSAKVVDEKGSSMC
uniref:Uncharacterized protein n=1 Tax=Oryzias melastigma TaxID=30732 RepID=A0A3B3BRF5_ORYME